MKAATFFNITVFVLATFLTTPAASIKMSPSTLNPKSFFSGGKGSIVDFF